MTVSILGRNVPEAYTEGLQELRIFGKEEMTRLGPAITIPDIVELSIINPDERVLFDPVRKANPFFHLMEFVWMMAGSQDAKWISTYNSRMMDFSDAGLIHGAYGKRWRKHFGVDQVRQVIRILREDHWSRRAVLAMWDPGEDLFYGMHDYPCNTQIMFRGRDAGRLDMTVINRSNDFVWGALGANAVHMTLLFELISLAAGKQMGTYRVISNNMHIYKRLPDFQDIYNTTDTPNPYFGSNEAVYPRPLLLPGESYDQFINDCERAVHTSLGWYSHFETSFFREVFVPVHFAYMERKMEQGDGSKYIKQIEASDWRMACELWTQWKVANQAE